MLSFIKVVVARVSLHSSRTLTKTLSKVAEQRRIHFHYFGINRKPSIFPNTSKTYLYKHLKNKHKNEAEYNMRW